LAIGDCERDTDFVRDARPRAVLLWIDTFDTDDTEPGRGCTGSEAGITDARRTPWLNIREQTARHGPSEWLVEVDVNLVLQLLARPVFKGAAKALGWKLPHEDAEACAR
jgi:hypothetical protein